jgi:hypothetical protein
VTAGLRGHGPAAARSPRATRHGKPLHSAGDEPMPRRGLEACPERSEAPRLKLTRSESRVDDVQLPDTIREASPGLYALDTELKLPARKTKADMLKAMEGHVLGQAELMGQYKRR